MYVMPHLVLTSFEAKKCVIKKMKLNQSSENLKLNIFKFYRHVFKRF